jgi:hypothetical protein
VKGPLTSGDIVLIRTSGSVNLLKDAALYPWWLANASATKMKKRPGPGEATGPAMTELPPPPECTS